jgi:PII-like signaling protein
MNGYQLTFFTQQNRRHDGQSLHEWLMRLARSLGIAGSTAVPGSEGYGRSGRLHSTHFFELAEQPMEVTMAATAEQAAALFARLAQEDVRVFYVKTPVEFGTTGSADTA